MARVRQVPRGDELDRIGRIGEQEFERLCTLARLECSRLIPDRIGVDFLVEFPLDPYSAKVSYDGRPAPRQEVVQVKTVTSKVRPAILALSVAERLIKRSEPTIVCWMLHDEGTDQIIEIRFIHLLNDGMSRILRALRQASSKRNADIRNATVQLPWRIGFKVEMSAFGLREALEQICAPGMEAYGIEKWHQLRTLGFVGNWLTGAITFTGLTPSELADAFLGLREVNVASLAMFEERFGIRLPFATFLSEEGEGILTITPDATDHCDLKVTDAAGCSWSVPADVFLLPRDMVGEGPFGLIKWAMGHIKLNHERSEATLSLDINVNGRRTAAEWLSQIEFVRAIFSGPCSVDAVTAKGKSRLADIDWQSKGKPEWLDESRDRAKTLKDAVEAMTLGAVAFSDEELRQDRDTIALIHAMCTRNIKLESFSPPWEMSDVEGVSTLYVTAFRVFDRWIGMAIPMVTSTEHSVGEIKWVSYRSAEPVFQRLADEPQESFDLFRDMLTKLAAPECVFSQKPGEFLCPTSLMLETTLIDDEAETL